METIITIKKNKPAFKALILLAKELEKKDHTSISVSETTRRRQKFELNKPSRKEDPSKFFEQLTDFPSLDELRNQAWPRITRRNLSTNYTD